MKCEDCLVENPAIKKLYDACIEKQQGMVQEYVAFVQQQLPTALTLQDIRLINVELIHQFERELFYSLLEMEMGRMTDEKGK